MFRVCTKSSLPLCTNKHFGAWQCYFGKWQCYFGKWQCYFGKRCYFEKRQCYFGKRQCYFGKRQCYFGIRLILSSWKITKIKTMPGNWTTALLAACHTVDADCVVYHRWRLSLQRSCYTCRTRPRSTASSVCVTRPWWPSPSTHPQRSARANQNTGHIRVSVSSLEFDLTPLSIRSGRW